VSPREFSRALDDVGAGTTYFVNGSCHSEAFNNLVQTTNTVFVGFADTKADRVSFDTTGGDNLIKNLKTELRRCRSLGGAFTLTEIRVSRAYQSQTEERRRQHPVLTNPTGASLEGKPWNDPAGWQPIVADALDDLDFTPLTAKDEDIVGSIDPNDKYALAGVGPARWVQPSQLLPFEIVFENRTNAAAPAQEVLVIDDLDPRLDWATFELKTIAFNDAKIAVPPKLQRFRTSTKVGTDPNEVDVDVDLNPASGRVTWWMRSRDAGTGDLPLDPFAGFLPPNDASHRGEGSLSFTVRPRPDLPDGTHLVNQATILFDPTYGANPPILTPWVTNTIDAVAPASAVQPLPPQGAGEIQVSWIGQDAPGSSGLASYDIYTSRNGAPYTAWLLATTNTTAAFSGQPGATYRFYSLARDAAGNTEAPPPEPDATISIEGGPGALTVTRQNGNVRVSFHGVLQWAPSVSGPWTDLTEAVSPALIAPLGPERYYRARQ
jgi:hypothetical protein